MQVFDQLEELWDIQNKEHFFAADAPTFKGQERVSTILKAAKDILVDEGAAGLTLRQVARKAGTTLSNLQHYYGTHDELIKGLLLYITKYYDAKYQSFLDHAYANPVEKLLRVYQFLIDETKDAETSALFFEIWAMAQHSEAVRLAMDEMYTYQRRYLAGLIQAASPWMPQALLHRRAALVTTQIEGLMLLLGKDKPQHEELQELEGECQRQLMRLSGIVLD